MKKKILISTGMILVLFFVGQKINLKKIHNIANLGVSILLPQQGGTGIGSATAGDVSKCLKVLDDSPFTYSLDTCGTGGGGSAGGTWSTTTSNVSGQLINYSNNTTDIVTAGANATTTAEFWFDPNLPQAYIGAKTGFSTTTPWAQYSFNPSGIGNIPAFAIGSSSATHFVVNNVGNVGIGTSTPSNAYKLSIGGNFFANGMYLPGQASGFMYFGSNVNLQSNTTSDGLTYANDTGTPVFSVFHREAFATPATIGEIKFAMKSNDDTIITSPLHIVGEARSNTPGDETAAFRYEFVTHGSGNTTALYIGDAGFTGKPWINIYGDGTDSPLNGVLAIRERSNVNKNLRLWYNATDDVGEIQAMEDLATYKSLLLNKSGGNVGIGTTSPTATFSINGLSSSPSTDLLRIASSTNDTVLSVTPAGITIPKNLSNVRYANAFGGSNCGAKINAAVSDLGASTAGEIWVNQLCGTTITSAVTLGANQVLRFTQGGTWTISAAITGGHIIGATPAGGNVTSAMTTVLKQANSANLAYMVRINTAGGNLERVEIDGNKSNNSGTTVGISVYRAVGVSLKDNYVHDTDGRGLYWEATNETSQDGNIPILQNNIFYNTDGDCARIDNSLDAFINMNGFEVCGGTGLTLYNTGGSRLTGNDFGGIAGIGLYATGTATGLTSSFLILNGNQFGNNLSEDIYIAGNIGGTYTSFGNDITGNLFLAGSFRTANSKSAIVLENSKGNAISGNMFNSTIGNSYKYAIETVDTGFTDEDTWMGNQFFGVFGTGEQKPKVGTTITCNDDCAVRNLTADTAGIASTTPWKQLSVGSSNTGTFAISTTTDGCAQFTKGQLWITGSSCGTGGGGGSGGTWATTTSTVSGQLINYPINSATDIVTIGSNSTTTAEFFFNPNGVSYGHIGAAMPTFGCKAGAADGCLEIVGNNNTINGGGQLELQNINAGGSAYTGLFLANNLANSIVTNYSGLFLNSSGYNDTTFGTANAVPNLLALQNTMGSISLQASTTMNRDTYINFLVGGNNTANEVGRFADVGLKLGTTTGSLAPLVAASSTMPQVVLSQGPGIAQWAMRVDNAGNLSISTTTVDGTATSTINAIVISRTGQVGLGMATTGINGVNTTGNFTNAVLNFAASTSPSGGISFGDSLTNLFRSASNGLRTNATTITIGDGTGNTSGITGPTGGTISMISSRSSTAGTSMGLTNSGTMSLTSGLIKVVQDQYLYAPTSGSGMTSGFEMNGTINQSGNSQGITRDIYINPVITKAADYRAFEIAPYSFAINYSTTTTNGSIFNAYKIGSTTTTTLTNAYNVNITGAPIASTSNMTITNSVGLCIGCGDGTGGTATTSVVSSAGVVTNAYSFQAYPPVGATNNITGSTTGKWFMSGLTASAGTPNSVCINATTKEITENAALTCTVSSKDYKTNMSYLGNSFGGIFGGSEDFMDLFMEIKPGQFAYKDNPQRLRWGFYAEDLAKIDRKLADGYDKDGHPRSIDQNAILALTVKAVQEIAQIKGIAPIKRSMEENWQWIAMGAMFLWIIKLQVEIKRK